MSFIVSDSSLSAKRLSLYVKAGQAEAGPPLGTVLGNLGVNSSKFCKEFNEFTRGLPAYLKLKVYINVYENRTFDFKVKLPSTPYFISLLKVEKTFIFYQGNFPLKKNIECIYLSDVLKLAKFQFPHHNLKESVSMC